MSLMQVMVGSEVCELISGNDTELLCWLDKGPPGTYDVTMDVYPYGRLPQSFKAVRAFEVSELEPKQASILGKCKQRLLTMVQDFRKLRGIPQANQQASSVKHSQ